MTARSNPKPGKPKLAVWKFSSCDGCQLSLLDCEDELLAVLRTFEAIGTDEVQLIPTSSDIDQLQRAADVAARL